jgi:hypothetical protein
MLMVTCRLLVTGGFTKLLFFVWLGSQVRLGQVGSGWVRLGQVGSGQVGSGQFGLGRALSGSKVVLAPRKLFIFVGGIELKQIFFHLKSF